MKQYEVICNTCESAEQTAHLCDSSSAGPAVHTRLSHKHIIYTHDVGLMSFIRKNSGELGHANNIVLTVIWLRPFQCCYYTGRRQSAAAPVGCQICALLLLGYGQPTIAPRSPATKRLLSAHAHRPFIIHARLCEVLTRWRKTSR